MRVLTWNLMHGRAQPPAGRELLDEFAEALRGWEWDVALLQEAPPWWPPTLAERVHGEYRLVLTTRNSLPAIRRALAARWPDLMKSGGGGCNAILVRCGRVLSHRVRRLCWLPERRWMHAVRIEKDAGSTWVANLHATAHNEPAARREAALAARTALAWAAQEPVVLGGDFNVRELSLAGFARAGNRDVDHVFVSGLAVEAEVEVLDCGTLSDHPPLVARVVAP